MNQREKEIIYHIIVLGDKDSQKSIFIRDYIFDYHPFTSLVSYTTQKLVTLNNGKIVKIDIHNRAYNYQSYKSLSRINFRSSYGFIIIYNVNKRESFENAKDYLEIIRYCRDNNNNIVLVGNKVKYCYDKCEIPTEEGKKFA